MENNQPIRVNFQALETKLIPLDAVVLYRNISHQYRHGVVLAGIFSHPSTQFEADLCLYFIRSIIEACLFAEIEYQLRLDFKSTGNKRNGYTRRTFNTAFGPLEIQVPRARQCTFEAKILVPFKRQLSNDFIEAVLGLYPRYKEIEQIKLQLLKVYSEQFHQTAPFNEIAEAVVIEILKWRMIRSMFAYVDAQLPNVRTGNRFIDGTTEDYRNAFSHVFQNRQVSPPETGGQPEAAPEAFDNYQPGYESYPEAYPQGYNGHQYPQYPQPPYPQNCQGRYQEYPPQYDNQYYDNYGQPYNEYSQEGYDYRQYDQYDPAYGQYDQAYEKYDQYGNPVSAHPNPAHNRQRPQGHYYGYEQGSQYDPAYDRRYSQYPQPAPQPTPRSNHPAPQGAPARYPRESHQPEPHPRRHPRPATPYDSPYAEAPESYASKPFDPAAELEAGFAEAGFSYQQPSKPANLAAKNADAATADKVADKVADKAADKSDAAVLEEQVTKQAQVGLAADVQAPVAKVGTDLAAGEAQVTEVAQTQVVAETVQATDDDGYGNESEVFNEKLLD